MEQRYVGYHLFAAGATTREQREEDRLTETGERRSPHHREDARSQKPPWVGGYTEPDQGCDKPLSRLVPSPRSPNGPANWGIVVWNHLVPPDTSLLALGPEQRGTAQDGDRDGDSSCETAIYRP